MENRFDLYTARAIRAIELSQEEARTFRHNWVGSEHILLGLLLEGNGIAYQALSQYMSLEEGRRALESISGVGPANDETLSRMMEETWFPLTQRSIKIMDTAPKLGSKYVDTEELLAALLWRVSEELTEICEELSVHKSMSSLEELPNGTRYIRNLPIASQIFHFLDVDVDGLMATLTELAYEARQMEGTELPTEFGYLEYGDSNPGSNTPSDVYEESRPSSTSSLDMYGTFMTEQAKEGKLFDAIGREEEIKRMIEILSRRRKNNPILLGEPGVGKTAIVEGLAIRVLAGGVPMILEDSAIFSLDLGSLVSGAEFRGQFEERLQQVVTEVQKAGNIIVFIDEIHTLSSAGAAEGAMDAANLLKPALARGELRCIGATTTDEYKKYFENDAALARRFQPIIIAEPSSESALDIMKGIRNSYEEHHDLKITDEALEAAVDLSNRYIGDRFLPDKAIDLIDEAASHVRLVNAEIAAPREKGSLRAFMYMMDFSEKQALRLYDYNSVTLFKAAKLQAKIDLRNFPEGDVEPTYRKMDVSGDHIAEIISEWTKIPANKLTESEASKLANLDNLLSSRVIGQDEGVEAVSRAIRRARTGVRNPNRPIASLLFVGPTGVGKTELSKALASLFFGSEDSMIRLDMSEYMERHTVSRLIGSPPGYVGFDEGGQLTEAVRKKPYSLVLLDEVEKAHSDVFNLMLQVFEDGRLTDAKGRLINFNNTLVIMTSNLGSKVLQQSAPSIDKLRTMVDLDPNITLDDLTVYDRIKLLLMEELKSFFRPEFLNRIDETIVFRSLIRDHMKKIANLMLQSLQTRLMHKEINFAWTRGVVEFLLNNGGFDAKYGARPMRRLIETAVEDRISNDLLQGLIKPRTKVLAHCSRIGKKVRLIYRDTPDKLTYKPDWGW
jgi:ATP-dependent Clp protease ATP-binding subunit ClpC